MGAWATLAQSLKLSTEPMFEIYAQIFSRRTIRWSEFNFGPGKSQFETYLGEKFIMPSTQGRFTVVSFEVLYLSISVKMIQKKIKFHFTISLAEIL